MTSNTIVTMTMASHSSHATAVTTSAIPVGKFFILCLWLGHSCVLEKQEVSVLEVFQLIFFTASCCRPQLKWSPSPLLTLHPVCSPTTLEREPTSSPYQAIGRLLTPSPWKQEVTTGEYPMLEK